MRSVAATLILAALPAQDPLWQTEPLTATVRAVALSPDGKHAASRGPAGHVVLYDVDKGTVTAHCGPATRDGMAFTPDSAKLVVFSPDGPVAYRTSDGKRLADFTTIAVHEHLRAHRHPSGTTVVRRDAITAHISTFWPRIHVGDTPTLTTRTWAIPAADTLVHAHAAQHVSPREWSRTITVDRVDLASGDRAAPIAWKQRLASGLGQTLPPATDGTHVALVADGRLQLVRAADRTVVARLGQRITAVLFDRGHWYTGHENGAVKKWTGTRSEDVIAGSETHSSVRPSFAAPQELRRLGDTIVGLRSHAVHTARGRIEMREQIRDVQGDGASIAVVVDGAVEIHRAAAPGKPVARAPLPGDQPAAIGHMRLLAAGRFASFDGLNLVVRAVDGPFTRRLNGHRTAVRAVHFGGPRILARASRSPGAPGPAALLDRDTGRVLRTHPGPIALSRRGVHLVYADGDDVVVESGIRSPRVVRLAAKGRARLVAIPPRGRHVAAVVVRRHPRDGDQDHLVVWETGEGQAIADRRVGAFGRSLEFIRDGEALLENYAFDLSSGWREYDLRAAATRDSERAERAWRLAMPPGRELRFADGHLELREADRRRWRIPVRWSDVDVGPDARFAVIRTDRRVFVRISLADGADLPGDLVVADDDARPALLRDGHALVPTTDGVQRVAADGTRSRVLRAAARHVFASADGRWVVTGNGTRLALHDVGPR